MEKIFSFKDTILLSAIIFGIGHIANAFVGTSTFETIITVVNAIIFGWMAIEITILAKNITPMIFIHFIFNIETKFVALNHYDLLIAELVRGSIMVVIALWLAVIIFKRNKMLFLEDQSSEG